MTLTMHRTTEGKGLKIDRLVQIESISDVGTGLSRDSWKVKA
jgi:hypothetical protein